MAYETRLGAGIRQLGDVDTYRMLRGKDLDITEATELSSLADADIFLVDDNAAGTQASTNKITAANLKTYINNGMSPVVGSSSITTLGTVTTGVWNATAITHDYIGLNAIDGTNIADNAINSEHYTDGSIDHAHLAVDVVDGTNIADNSINSSPLTPEDKPACIYVFISDAVIFLVDACVPAASSSTKNISASAKVLRAVASVMSTSLPLTILKVPDTCCITLLKLGIL